MESGLTRDGRATTVSHTRFGRARRPRFISTLYIYLGASQPFLRGCIFAPAPPGAGLPRCAVFRRVCTAPGARRNRAGSERPYTKVPPPCQSPLRAVVRRGPCACRRTHRGILPPCAHAVTEHPHFYGIGHPDEKRTCPNARWRTSVFPFHHAPCGDAVRDADALQRRVECSGGVCYLLTYGGGLNAPAASSRLVRE